MACKRSAVRTRYSPQASLLRLAFVFMYKVYIIYSKVIDQYYIGQTSNLENRLYRHNNSGSKSTKKANDWVLKYSETFETRSEAVKRESEIKSKKRRAYIEGLISSELEVGLRLKVKEP